MFNVNDDIKNEYLWVKAEIKEASEFLKRIPEERVIERRGFQGRLTQLASDIWALSEEELKRFINKHRGKGGMNV